MLRRFVQLHTVVLAAASAVLLIAPLPILAGLGIVGPSLPVLSLTRVIAVLLVIVAAAVLPLPAVAESARRSALLMLTAAYGASAVLLLVQETAIWGTALGAVLPIITGAFAGAFAAAAVVEARHHLAAA